MKRPARHAPALPARDYYAEGRAAWRAGKPVNACPYPSGFSAERDWITGWVDALLAEAAEKPEAAA